MRTRSGECLDAPSRTATRAQHDPLDHLRCDRHTPATRTAIAALAALVLLVTPGAGAQSHVGKPHVATIRETSRTFVTYPFGDPDPIPTVGRIYPYFRFDGFTATGVPKSWKVIELENDWIKVLILPEIGGKIWAAIEKGSGKPFIYFNHAVKFRDIAMRGPWTSGGIEINYGIIGHTPNVATPVDYVTRRNPDGSVSCIVGALDLLTMTTWRLETRLAPDRAAFTTSSTWHNRSSLEQPYYTWMTAGIPTAGGLRYVFPGSAWIGHEGELGSWPVNSDNGRDVSVYDDNDFGPYKSYHVLGAANDFFGAWWHDTGLGMARVAPRDEKPGQKIWIWGLSRQGMIWESLLTDSDGQYSELQSGRLFNQTSEGSTRTPFKHRGFTPHLTDRWSEQWQPVTGTDGFVVAGTVGAMNVTRDGRQLTVAISPVDFVDDTLVVLAGGRVVHRERVKRAPLQTFARTLQLPDVPDSLFRVVLGHHALEWSGRRGDGALARPLQAPAAFDWSSAYGLALKGKELIRDREYLRGAAALDSSLAREPFFVPALADRAMLALRAMRPDSALDFARRALAVDAYDGAANYWYGLANRALGRFADARDGFEISSQSAEWRSAAWTQLARLWLAHGDDRRALQYATKALGVERANLDALGVRVVAARHRRANAEWERAVAAYAAADPLSVMPVVERRSGMKGASAAAARSAMAQLHGEMPEQRLFDLAAWYQDVGDATSATAVLAGIGDNPEALFWRAALSEPASAATLIERANARDARMVFPFRAEVINALEYAVQRTTHWKPLYYLALGRWATQRTSEAVALFDALGDSVPFAPFYAARANLPQRPLDAQVHDLERATALDRNDWRYVKRLAERLVAARRAHEGVRVVAAAYAVSPDNYMLGLTNARALLEAGMVEQADSLLGRLRVLPYEGAADGHALYREVKLLRAVRALRAGNVDSAGALVAEARLWPERLGAGRPYDSEIDARFEDLIAADIAERRGDATAARASWERLAGWRRPTGGVMDAWVPYALAKLGRLDDARVVANTLGVRADDLSVIPPLTPDLANGRGAWRLLAPDVRPYAEWRRSTP